MATIHSVIPELDGKRRLEVRPWKVRPGDVIEFTDACRWPCATFLVKVAAEPINMGRGPISGRTRYEIRVHKVRPLEGHTYWDPDTATWYCDDRVEVYR